MSANSSTVAAAFVVCAVCACTFTQGCVRGGSGSPVVHKETGILLQVEEQVFDHGWKIAGGIIVRRDGTYRRTIHDLSKVNSVSQTVEGHLPETIVRDLQEDVLQSDRFDASDGVPTYRYGIDDQRVDHPSGIGQLLSFVGRWDRWKKPGTRDSKRVGR